MGSVIYSLLISINKGVHGIDFVAATRFGIFLFFKILS
jgi:hypothetical protein